MFSKSKMQFITINLLFLTLIGQYRTGSYEAAPANVPWYDIITS